MVLPFGEGSQRKEKATLLNPGETSEEWEHWGKLSGLASPSNDTADELLCDKSSCWCKLFLHSSPVAGRMQERVPDAEVQDCLSLIPVHWMHVTFWCPSAGGRSAVIAFRLPFDLGDSASKILENPLQKQFWIVSALPYCIIFKFIDMLEAGSFSHNSSLLGLSLCCFWDQYYCIK